MSLSDAEKEIEAIVRGVICGPRWLQSDQTNRPTLNATFPQLLAGTYWTEKKIMLDLLRGFKSVAVMKVKISIQHYSGSQRKHHQPRNPHISIREGDVGFLSTWLNKWQKQKCREECAVPWFLSSFGPTRVSAGTRSVWWTDFHHWQRRTERGQREDRERTPNISTTRLRFFYILNQEYGGLVTRRKSKSQTYQTFTPPQNKQFPPS